MPLAEICPKTSLFHVNIIKKDHVAKKVSKKIMDSCTCMFALHVLHWVNLIPIHTMTVGAQKRAKHCLIAVHPKRLQLIVKSFPLELSLPML